MIDGRRHGAKGASHDGPGSNPGGETGTGPQAPADVAWYQLGPRLANAGVSADAVTILGLVIAASAAVAIGSGNLYIGVVLLTVGGLMDFLDGAVAKAAGTASTKGAFFDSVSDRVADALIFGGVGWYLVNGRHPKLALLAFAILAVSSVVSYERAKAESLGFNAKGGLMERAERLILLGVGLFFHVVLVEVLWLLLALTIVTALGRFLKVWRQATGAEVLPSRWVSNPWHSSRAELRWSERRQDGNSSGSPDFLHRRIGYGPRRHDKQVGQRSTLSSRRAVRQRERREGRRDGSNGRPTHRLLEER